MATLHLAPIGNCAIASLIDPEGRHVWFCFPRLDGDPVFNALVNGERPERGFMEVKVAGGRVVRQGYFNNTAVLETEIVDMSGGHLRLVDFAPRFPRFGRSFRPPLLVRRIEPLSGRPRVAARIRPTFDYGAALPQVSVGSNHLRFIGPNLVIRVTTDMPISYLSDEAEFALDRPITLFVGADETIPENPNSFSQSMLAETISYWRGWVRGLAISFDWQDEVIRAAIALKLCSFEDTGAIVAALTTSIPEAPTSQRNWDYRFCWLRDAYFTVNALNRLGATHTMEDFIRFVTDAALRDRDKEIPPLYPIAPATPVTEREATALAGYRGIRPVRVGNAAAGQRQNDSHGSIILTAAQAFWDSRLTLSGDKTLYGQLCAVGAEAQRAALEPDSGLWEYRGRTVVHTYSAAMCWAALHRLGLIAQRLRLDGEAQVWLAQANTLRDEILKRATARDGSLSGALDAEVADASSLLLPAIGLLPSQDERVVRTLALVERRLMRGGFVMRYVEADDFGVPETAFLVCTLWYAEALAGVGRQVEAAEVFGRVLARRNPVGLLSEDIDVATGELWGNFPQTYSQVGIIHAAARLSRSWEEGIWRAS